MEERAFEHYFYVKNNFFKKSMFFIVLFCILVSGCSFSGDFDNSFLKAAGILSANNSGSSEKVRINLDFEDTRSRTILASQVFTNLTFSGERTSGGGYSTDANTKEELCTQEIWLQTGKWTFTLSGVIDGVTFEDKVENFDLTPDNASISFVLKPIDASGNSISTGALDLVLNFSGTADYAYLSIKNMATGGYVENKKEYAGLASNKKIEYLNTFKNNSGGLEPGTYLITVEFYLKVTDDDSASVNNPPLNVWQAYARIKPGLTAAEVIDSYDLTESYTITYHDIDTENDVLDSGSVAILCYSRKSGTITLPSYTNAAGFKILCWYETELNINTLGITSFESSKLKDMDLYPLWDTDTVYVAENGIGNALTEAKAASSVAEALSTLQKLNEYGSEQTALTVQISGVVTGTTTIGTSLDDFAASLTLCGKTGNTVDSLYGNNSGTVLTVNTAVPVIVQKIKTYGGMNIGDSSGGGIFIDSGANVTLGTGALVGDLTKIVANSSSYGNYAKWAGGIYNKGTLTLDAGSHVCHNYGTTFGGGIWNEGGSVTIKDGAEISYNCADSTNSRGGGIRNGGDGSSVKMEGGTIAHNSSYFWGGGVMLQGGEFTMTGGTIAFNKSTGLAADIGGGGIWIDEGTFRMSGNSILCGNEAKVKGGGIHLEHDTAIVEITGGTISGNKVTAGSGGGIFINNGSLSLNGGTIENNSASQNGGAVYVSDDKTLYICGTASIPYGVKDEEDNVVTGAGKNDVYLSSNAYITVAGSLTGTAPVATITPATYTDGTTVLSGETSLLSANYNKFSLSDDENYFIGAGGILYGLAHTSSTVDDFKDYLSILSSDKEATLTISSNLATNTLKQSTPALTIPAGTNVTLTAESTKKIEFTKPDNWENSSGDYTFIKVNAGATLTIGSGIIIKGNSYDGAFVTAIYVENGGTLIMENGASITGFKGNGSGIIIVAKGGTFTMNGGTISDCKARYGAAVYINGGGTFNFYGGTIKNMTEVNGASIYGSGTMNRKVSETTLTNASVGSGVNVNEITE